MPRSSRGWVTIFYSFLVVLGRVAKLADAPDLGSGGETHGGSSPLSPIDIYLRGVVPTRSDCSGNRFWMFSS